MNLRNSTKLIILGIVVFFLTLGVFAARNTYDTLTEEWLAQSPAYNVKHEYLASVFIGGGRDMLIEDGYDPEGWLLSFLKWLQTPFYESALKKIPEHDAERIMFWHFYVYRPAEATENIDYIASLGPDLLNAIEALHMKESANRFVDEIYRYDLLQIYMSEFLSSSQYFRLNDEEDEWRGRLISIAIDDFESMKLEKFFSQRRPGEVATPLLYANIVYRLILKQLEDERESQCDEGTINHLKITRDYILALLPKYQLPNKELSQVINIGGSDEGMLKKELPPIYQQAISAIAQRVKKTYPEMQSLLKQKCKIEL